MNKNVTKISCLNCKQLNAKLKIYVKNKEFVLKLLKYYNISDKNIYII